MKLWLWYRCTREPRCYDPASINNSIVLPKHRNSRMDRSDFFFHIRYKPQPRKTGLFEFNYFKCANRERNLQNTVCWYKNTTCCLFELNRKVEPEPLLSWVSKWMILLNWIKFLHEYTKTILSFHCETCVPYNFFSLLFPYTRKYWAMALQVLWWLDNEWIKKIKLLFEFYW